MSSSPVGHTRSADGNTYLLRIHIKTEKYKRALECAEAALKIDEYVVRIRRDSAPAVVLTCTAFHSQEQRQVRDLFCPSRARASSLTCGLRRRAKFRAAQARIGQGEITKGKAALEDLQKKKPDVAIANALKQLAADEKARTAQAQSTFSESRLARRLKGRH